MRCPECEAEGTYSVVYDGPRWVTAMCVERYWDEDGRYHLHNPNTVAVSYECSQGHRWTAKDPAGVCWCGWGGEGAPRSASDGMRRPDDRLGAD